MTTPLLAIDIDGVLSPLVWSKAERKALTARGFRSIEWRGSYTPGRNSTWHPYSQLWLSRTHGDMLARFSTEHDVELVWASMWSHNCSPVVSRSIGLPRLPYVDFFSHPSGPRVWKYDAVADFAAGRPLAWLDDGFSSHRVQRGHSSFDHSRRNLPTLLHQVDARVGLQRSDLNAVASWLRLLCLAW
jgi:hypothetical protein